MQERAGNDLIIAVEIAPLMGKLAYPSVHTSGQADVNTSVNYGPFARV